MTTHTERGVEEILHFVQRLRERWGIDICPDEYRNLCEDIMAGRAIRLLYDESGYTHCLVQIRSRTIPVIFSHKTKNMTTALPSCFVQNSRYVPALTELVSRVARSRSRT